MCLAVPGKIVTITPGTSPGAPDDLDLFRVGKVSFEGVLKTVNLAYVPEAQIGDYVIVHTGFAISVLDPEEAEQTLRDIPQVLG
ncbi:MAG: HypC/HybG/HupF family hydrogenase formation chaperone [Prochlorotrichaceae cyanobacterium]|jgi:hydrogenase expression/formation protein HypC